MALRCLGDDDWLIRGESYEREVVLILKVLLMNLQIACKDRYQILHVAEE